MQGEEYKEFIDVEEALDPEIIIIKDDFTKTKERNLYEYECYFCNNFKAGTVDEVTSHINKHHFNLPLNFECVFQNCDFTGLLKDDMRHHYQEMHEKVDLMNDKVCLVCNEQRCTSDQLDRHVRIVHLMEYEYVCSRCKDTKYFASFNLNEWVDHVCSNHPTDPPTLDIIEDEGYAPKGRHVPNGKSTDQRKLGRGTVETSPKSQNYQFECIICGKRRLVIDSIEFHVKNHFLDEKVICPHCPHVSESPAELIDHGEEHYPKFSLFKKICVKCKDNYVEGDPSGMLEHSCGI